MRASLVAQNIESVVEVERSKNLGSPGKSRSSHEMPSPQSQNSCCPYVAPRAAQSQFRQPFSFLFRGLIKIRNLHCLGHQRGPSTTPTRAPRNFGIWISIRLDELRQIGWLSQRVDQCAQKDSRLSSGREQTSAGAAFYFWSLETDQGLESFGFITMVADVSSS